MNARRDAASRANVARAEAKQRATFVQEVAKADPKQALQWVDRWCDSDLADQIAWHKRVNSKVTEQQIDAYSAGFNDGWRRCIAALKLHNIIK
jgi:hypothetical protein